MGIITNGTNINNVICNGVQVQKVICNGTVVYNSINYLTFTGSFDATNVNNGIKDRTITANNYNRVGRAWMHWYNNTGSTESITITIKNRCTTYDESSGSAIYINTTGYSDTSNGYQFRLEYEDAVNYGTTTQTVSVPSGYYLIWFNQWAADTIITAYY